MFHKHNDAVWKSGVIAGAQEQNVSQLSRHSFQQQQSKSASKHRPCKSKDRLLRESLTKRKKKKEQEFKKSCIQIEMPCPSIKIEISPRGNLVSKRNICISVCVHIFFYAYNLTDSAPGYVDPPLCSCVLCTGRVQICLQDRIPAFPFQLATEDILWKHRPFKSTEQMFDV